MNCEHIDIGTGGEQSSEAVIETVLHLAGGPQTAPTGRPGALFFGFRRAAVSIGPSDFDENIEVSLHLERAGASHLGAKDDADALFDLLAAKTDWRLELRYNDGRDEGPDRMRPLLAP